MSRGPTVFLAALLVVAGSFGMAEPALAAAPNAVNDTSIVVQKNATATTINVLANDTFDPEATISAVTAAGHGNAGVAVGGLSVTYTPTAGYTGLDTFDYTITDPDGADGADTATVSLRVNAPPVAVDDPPAPSCSFPAYGGSFPIPEDYGQFAFLGQCSALANDTDPDGSIATWQVDVLPQHGTLEWLDTIPSVFGYTPNPDFSTAEGDWVSDSITYHLVDNNGASSNQATYRFWIAPINDPPIFTSVPDVTVATNSGPFDASWLGNVSPGPNETGQTVHFHITTVSSHGVVNLFSVRPDFTAGGHLTFTPGPGEFGFADVTVYLQDDGGLNNYGFASLPDPPDDTSDPVTFRINVVAVGVPPNAGNDTATIGEDAGASPIDVLGNDSDPDGDLFTITAVTQGGKGAVSISAGGTGLKYTPNPNANGPDYFTYTITDSNGLTDVANVAVTILPVDDPPVAVDDAKTLTEDDGATAIDVRANDTDPEGDPLSITLVTQGDKGVVAITGGGTGLTYTPDADANGADSFSYSIDDGNGGSDIGTVNVTVTAVEDPPVAVDDSKRIAENAGPTAILVLANDSDVDGDTLTIIAKTNGAKGTVTITGSGTGLTYVPDLNAIGADSFTYTIDDGHGGTSTATVNVSISNEEQPPDAVDDSMTLLEDAAATSIPVLANDSDVDGDPLTITLVTQGGKGSVAITGSGSGLTYTPDLDANGGDTFTYTIDDGLGGTSTATVRITITPVNDLPTAATDAVTVSEDQNVAGVTFASAVDVLANDTDVDGDPLTVTAMTNGAKGSVAIIGGGSAVSYKPNVNAFGTDTFTYTVSDGNGGSRVGTVNVTITPVNDPPNAVNDGVPTPVKVWLNAGAQSIPVLANDTSLPDGPETLHITAVSQAGHGAVAITGGGTGLTYRPTGTATGIDVFTYTISDGALTDTASVQVTVAKDTSPPTAAILSIQKSTIPGRTGLRIYVHWSLSDVGSGLKSQVFQRRTDSGSWVTVSLSSITTRTVSLGLARGHAYTFRVRGTDKAGNVGAYASRQIRI